MIPKLQTELERLYKKEINVTLSSDWDNQWTVALGNELNPTTQEERGLTLHEVAQWLATKHNE